MIEVRNSVDIHHLLGSGFPFEWPVILTNDSLCFEDALHFVVLGFEPFIVKLFLGMLVMWGNLRSFVSDIGRDDEWCPLVSESHFDRVRTKL